MASASAPAGVADAAGNRRGQAVVSSESFEVLVAHATVAARVTVGDEHGRGVYHAQVLQPDLLLPLVSCCCAYCADLSNTPLYRSTRAI